MSANTETIALHALVLALQKDVFALQQEIDGLRRPHAFYVRESDGDITLMARQELDVGFFEFLHVDGLYTHSVEATTYSEWHDKKIEMRKICDGGAMPFLTVFVRKQIWTLYFMHQMFCCTKSELWQRLYEIDDAIELWMPHTTKDLSQFRTAFDEFLRVVRVYA